MPTRTPTLAEVFAKAREGILRDLRVAVPGVIHKYDASTQLAEVQPLVADFFEEDDDSFTSIQLPLLINVPVIFPGGGGFRVTFPVAVGDVVQVIISDRSLDAWLSEGGLQSPVDQRRHHLSDAVCIPGLHDNKHPWTGAGGGDLTLGKDGGPQVHIDSSLIKLGTSASEAVLNGDAYRSAEDTMLTAIASALTDIAAAITTTANITAHGAAAATAALAGATAINSFKSGGSGYKSTKVKVLP